MDFIRTAKRTLPASALCLLLAGAAGGAAHAAKQNRETGETCRGADCANMGGGSSSGNGTGDSAGDPWRLANVETYGCTGQETEKIHIGVKWLQDHLGAPSNGRWGATG